MGSNDVPFGGRGRPINPRFSLNLEPEGVETEDFSPKRNPSSFPERVARSVPKPIEDSDSNTPAVIPTGWNERPMSPNSLFNSDDDSLSLDVGVNETDSEPASTKADHDLPRAVFDDVSPTSGDQQTVRAGLISDAVQDDDLSLDIGVNETEEEDFSAPKENSSSSVLPPSVTVPLPSSSVSVSEEKFEEDDLSLDVGVNETDEVIAPVVVSPPAQMSSPVPVVRPAVSRPRVNPLFADPTPEGDEELSLDVGVNETDEKPAKRVVSPLFDFKSDVTVPVKRKPEARRMRPDAMIDSGDEASFEEEKKSRKSSKASSKKVEPTRRPFQIQERDITLLRFLTKYQFSYVDAIARVLDSTPQSINKRLRTLEEYDLVKRETIAAGSTLWQSRKAGIELAGMNFKENKRAISFATIRHTIGLVNLATELEREAPGSKDILGLSDKFGEEFPVRNRFPGGIRLYGEEALNTPLTYGEMTVSEREIRQGQKRYRGGRSSAEMRDIVDFAILNPEAPELEPGNEGLFVVYGSGGKTGEHVPDLVVTRPRGEDGKPQHFAIELELTPKSPGDWKRILRSYRENGGMYSRIYYFTSDRPIANMIRNADEEVGLGDRLILRKYTPKNKRQPFKG